MSELLDRMAKEVAEEQKSLDSKSEETRKRVISMGRKLKKMQDAQKKEQKKAKAAGEPVQSWKGWCEAKKLARPTFPESSQCARYILIARYPGAFRTGMSIKEAYKEAGLWKKNGGSPPLEGKTVTPNRLLLQLQKLCGRASARFEKASDAGIAAIAEKEQWDQDEVDGALEELVLFRQSLNAMITQIRKVAKECGLGVST